jgi:hypothetical protein
MIRRVKRFFLNKKLKRLEIKRNRLLKEAKELSKNHKHEAQLLSSTEINSVEERIEKIKKALGNE